MKKLFIVASLIATTLFSAMAQDAPTITAPLTTPIVSKRGYAILPEADDWSLSLDASTSLKYIGQLFTTQDNSTAFSFPITQTVLVRKFIDANTAYRGIVGINLTSATTKNFVNQLGSTSTPVAQVEDKRRVSSSLVNIGVGLEKRKGISRVQGIYGAEAIVGFSGSGTSYTYGNPFGNGGTPVSTTAWDPNITENQTTTRTLSAKSGKTISLSVLAFAGVEYFFAPKISLGGEFTWGPRIALTGKGKTEQENLTAGASQTVTTETAGSSNISLDLQNAGGALRLNFYF